MESRKTLSGLKKSTSEIHGTVTKMEYPFYLMPLETFLDMFYRDPIQGETNSRRFSRQRDSSPSYPTLRPHQDLLRSGHLMKWDKRTHRDDTIIFVSHEWLGFTHPDPSGLQTNTLATVLRRLRDGRIDRVNTDSMTRLMFGSNRITKAEEWRALLKRAWIWIDFISIPQPQAEAAHAAAQEGNRNINHRAHRHERSELLINQKRAVKSLAAYVELSSFFVVLAPGCLHEAKTEVVSSLLPTPTNQRSGDKPKTWTVRRDMISRRANVRRTTRRCWGGPSGRRDSYFGEVETEVRSTTCYRTWRSRGWCLLELYAAMLSRKQKDLLIVTSAERRPNWASPVVEACYAAPPGYADFSCCALNHDFGDGPVECDKLDVRDIMMDLLRSKIQYMFRESETMTARFFLCVSHMWLRGLPSRPRASSGQSQGSIADDDDVSDAAGAGVRVAYTNASSIVPRSDDPATALSELRRVLRWGQLDPTEATRIDTGLDTGMTLMKWCVLSDNAPALREHLREIAERVTDPTTRRALIEAPTRVNLSCFGFPLHSTNLLAATAMASPDVVVALLEAGANPEAHTFAGTVDPFMAACVFGNYATVQCWLDNFPDWDIDRDNGDIANALCYACMFGGMSGSSEILKVIKCLVRAGADVSFRNRQGLTPLMFSQMCKDAHPSVVAYLLKCLCHRATTTTRRIVDADTTSTAIEDAVASEINRKAVPRTIRDRIVSALYTTMYRTGAKRRGMVRALAMNVESTAIHWAARRGDAAMVRQLLCAGADPHQTNAVGADAAAFAQWKGPFPAVDAVLEEFHTKGRRGMIHRSESLGSWWF